MRPGSLGAASPGRDLALRLLRFACGGSLAGAGAECPWWPGRLICGAVLKDGAQAWLRDRKPCFLEATGGHRGLRCMEGLSRDGHSIIKS